MGGLPLIIKDNKSLFFEEKFVFLWNLSALGTAYEKKKQALEFKKKKKLISVSRIYRPSAI